MSQCVVVDYGIGNIFSVCNALKKIGIEPKLSRNLSELKQAERLILPGVGAFSKAMDSLRFYGLDDAIRCFVDSGRPFLGICIGMQVLMDASSEFGEHAGLGLIPGRVKKIASTATDGSPLRVPHISWAQVEKAPSLDQKDWETSVLAGMPKGSTYYYFVHSYMPHPDNQKHMLAQAKYGGYHLTAAVRRGNITGVQFHPERSGANGLRLLQRFVQS